MFSFVTVPTDLVASISTTSGDVFTSMVPVAVIAVGITLGLAFLSWGINKLKGKRGRR